ncbi:MAG: FtsH protease activity modulator HflK [Acetobacteraceae bacterium]
MASNNGPNPWGTPGEDPRSDGPGKRPDEPWGEGRPGPGPRGPNQNGDGGPRGNKGGPIPPMPDLDRIIAEAQEAVRRFLGRHGGGGLGGGRGLSLLGLAVLALWLASGLYRVEPDQEGVVQRFGAFTRLTPPGLNYHLPWPIEGVETPAVTRVNRIEIGYRSGESGSGDVPIEAATSRESGRDVAQESLMLTGDENIVDVNVAVLWRINNVVDFLFNTRDPRTTIKSVTESSLREVMGRTPIQPALGPLRAQIADDVMRQAQQILDGYKAGVQIVQVLPQTVDPPAAVIESFRDVQRANTDAERIRNQAQSYANDIVPRARGEASRIVAIAEGDRQAAIARATGESKRFESVLAAYQAAKDVTMKRLYLDTMQDVLTHSQTVVLDDKLRGVLPFLSVAPETGTPPATPPAPSPSPPASATGAKP